MEQGMFAQPWLSTHWYFPEEMGGVGSGESPEDVDSQALDWMKAAPKNDDKESRHHLDSANSKRKI